jgi:hypothetical protein
VIAEGIEDALSLHQTTLLGAWASASAAFMPAMARSVPSWIECVTIELHPDNGQRFALKLADALRSAGIEVFLREACDE